MYICKQYKNFNKFPIIKIDFISGFALQKKVLCKFWHNRH